MIPTPPSRDLLCQQLQATPFFADVDAQVVRQLTLHAHWREYAAGELVMLEGEMPSGLYYLQAGWVKVVKTAPSGREQTLRFMEAGETFNEIGVFTNQPNPATAIALEAAGVWLIPRAAVRQLLREQPEFAEQLIAKLSERIVYLVSLVSDLSLHTVANRLARLLLESADDEGVLRRPRWYTQAELAARLGTVPDVVQRALRELENDGLIQVEKQQIRIINRPALAALIP
jgi:CRP/FNR family transcriptional regulator